jgi:DNA-binding MarR family transcriptional regulator
MHTKSLDHDSAHAINRREFIEFVRQVSPGADVRSVMLFGQIMRTSHLLMHVAEKNLESAGLTWAKFRLLMNLLHAEKHGHADGMQPSELSERQDISRNTVSALLASLEDDGLVSRELHPADRRRFLIRLTPEGRALLHAELDRQFKLVGEYLDVLTDDERQALLDHLTRLTASLQERARLCK